MMMFLDVLVKLILCGISVWFGYFLAKDIAPHEKYKIRRDAIKEFARKLKNYHSHFIITSEAIDKLAEEVIEECHNNG